VGPPLIALAAPSIRPRLLASSIQARGLVRLPSALIAALIASAVSPHDNRVDSDVMAVAMSLTGLSSAWFVIGLGRASLIAIYEIAPRIVATVGAAIREVFRSNRSAVTTEVAGGAHNSLAVMFVGATAAGDRVCFRRQAVSHWAILRFGLGQCAAGLGVATLGIALGTSLGRITLVGMSARREFMLSVLFAAAVGVPAIVMLSAAYGATGGARGLANGETVSVCTQALFVGRIRAKAGAFIVATTRPNDAPTKT
jgi:hypothetical protein